MVLLQLESQQAESATPAGLDEPCQAHRTTSRESLSGVSEDFKSEKAAEQQGMLFIILNSKPK